ncbi:hypothetical protein NP590_09670 [Methylomonas sp. SURF-2]|uniref:Capsule biosynthesis GfcC-like C-terminal domain-containing protein n=1 Tax=Methylomonas subterranea TaxID=2952225 RepID=A0ABT1TFY3_9GAMM|nr:hypothetical protein [Methylomonas sp. SURF-2]MCQ8104369.1 hypothetical protein [Methylomonas sp. SURF-2]
MSMRWFCGCDLKLFMLSIAVALGLQACATPPLILPAQPDAAACERFFADMDVRVAEHDATDAAAARIAGFAGLRVDRFLASFAGAELTADAYAAWLERLRLLDETGRRIEWRNLPYQAKSPVPAAGDADALIRDCGRLLVRQMLDSPGRRRRLLGELRAPDEYSTWRRLLGLYALSRWAIVDGVRQLHAEMRAPFLDVSPEQSGRGKRIFYAPPAAPAIGAEQVAAILARSAANPLAIPEPPADQLERLFSAYAPAWAVETLSDDDRIGTLGLDADGKAYLDPRKPSVYRLVSHTRFGNQVLLQLNYLIWFPARTSSGMLDIYAGRFDGLIWRVTLSMDGRPLAYDSIHACGCYYQLFPGEGLRVVQAQDGSEAVLTPMPILARQPGERLLVKVSAGKHFIDGISVESLTRAEQYHWLDYHMLRSLPISGTGYKSVFDQDGLLPGSERPERFLLWPMGVPSAGAMRQWGRHAVAFLGKRHFDDPRLLENLLRPLWE